MKNININNGLGPNCTPEEALAEYSIDTLAYYMDDDTREQVHNAFAPCSDLEFLTEYLKLAPHDLISG